MQTFKLRAFRDAQLQLVAAVNGNLCCQCQAARPPSPIAMTLQLCQLHLLPPSGSNSSCLFPGCRPLCASRCTALLYFLKHETVLFLVCFFMHYLYEKNYCRVRELEKMRFRRTRRALYGNRSPSMRPEGAAVRLAVSCCTHPGKE